VRAICGKAARSFETLGATVAEAHPDLTGAKKAFFTLRNLERVLTQAKLVEEHEAALTPTLVHYVRHGMALIAKEIGKAESVRGSIYRNVVAFFKEFDVLITPTVVAPPFAADMLHLMEMEGHKFEDYFEYLALTYVTTLIACPVISVPCDFTKGGLPVGLQIVGLPRGEMSLLSAAAAFEALHGLD